MSLTDPLSPASGAAARLGLAAALVGLLWLLVVWAIA
jgi:hypothetical protein